jgi:two-component system cell cycle sensor histidine kinase/response regulator CckA
LGYKVMVSASPDLALSVAESEPGRIDGLVTDVMMPKMNGFVLRRRMLDTQPGLRVLYMSGHPMDLITDLDAEALTASVLKKPFTVKRLAQQLREVLDA